MFMQNNGVETILQTLNIPVHTIKPDNEILQAHQRGLTIKVVGKNEYAVFIRHDLTVEERQHVLCHELGHITLGHMTDERFPYMLEEQREKEADQFAEFVLSYIYKPFVVSTKKQKPTSISTHAYKSAFKGGANG